MKKNLPDLDEQQVCKPRYLTLVNFASTLTIIFFILLTAFMVIWVSTHYAKPIEGASMQPGINNYETATGDIALVNTRTNFTYGDIIIANMYYATVLDGNLKTKLLIKRVIAKEGDTIKFVKEGDYYYTYLKKSNETEFTKLVEDYINPMTSYEKYRSFNNQINWARKWKFPQNEDGSLTIPQGFYFAMGDNRNDSYDCRQFGPLELETCMGVVETILKKGNVLNTFFTWIGNLQEA